MEDNDDAAYSQVCIVTGGASGMGAATAALYASRGHSVVVADRSIELGETVTAAITQSGGIAVFAELDIASEASVKRIIEFTLRTYGRIDSAVHAAGIGGPSCPAHEVTAEDYQKVVAIDQTGTFYLLKHLVAHWLTQEPRVVRDYTEYGLGKIYQRGCIVSLASINAHVASRNMSAYGSAKHGLVGISKSFAFENAQEHIRVNTVSPGCVFTPIMQAPGFNFNDVKELYVQNQAIKRFAHPVEIAETLYFLNSDEASFCTGQDWIADLGWTAH